MSVNGCLVHSRKKGDGLVDNQQKISSILRAVENYVWNILKKHVYFWKWKVISKVCRDDLDKY